MLRTTFIIAQLALGIGAAACFETAELDPGTNPCPACAEPTELTPPTDPCPLCALAEEPSAADRNIAPPIDPCPLCNAN